MGSFNATVSNDSDGSVYQIAFEGGLSDVNLALAQIFIKPTCPFMSQEPRVAVVITAQGQGSKPATG